MDKDPGSDLRAAFTGQAWRQEPPDRKRERLRRLVGHLPEHETEEALDHGLERVLGQSDLMPARWLAQGVRVSGAVGCLHVRVGGRRVSGTGFLVSPWLLMTNHHVLPSTEVATGAEVAFGYQEGPDGSVPAPRRHTLQPGRFFRTSPIDRLDYTLVAVGAGRDGRPPGETLGTIPLIGAVGKILVGEPVNVIQHPAGRPLEIAVRDNRLLSLDDERTLTYKTDTEPGSSGSPAFNDQWELVALHHSSVPARDAAGRPVDRFGQPVTTATPDSRRHWVANEGIRVSALVRDIRAGDYSADEQRLVDELFEVAP